jgi:wyosine [tRNA(Phe)-imidazoG37] synthetase (radical SAM superfamily)
MWTMNTDCTFEYKTLFGPVPSRRLGISLGVDLVRHKTCSLDCVYCECGATTHLTTKRNEYVSVARVKKELAAYLSCHKRIDHITFSGSGEPTLNEGIGDVIEFLKSDFPQYKVALLTNSTLFDQAAVRRQVKDADVVMASLDTATDARFKAVNRPHPMLDLSAIIDGIGEFRKMFTGRLLMECFLVNGSNDVMDELHQLKAVLNRIRADGILLNTLDRPGTEAWVQPVEADRLKNISDFLEGAEIITYRATPPETAVGHEDLLERLVSTIRRRPYTAQDVSRIMGLDVETVQHALEQLVASGRFVVKRMNRGRFYTVLKPGDACEDS